MSLDAADPALTPSPFVPYATYAPTQRTCPECGLSFETKSRTKLFCSSAHKLTFHNRCAARGKVLIPLAMAWRGGRGSGDTAKRAFMRMSTLLDEWNSEDRAAKRVPMLAFVARGFEKWQRR